MLRHKKQAVVNLGFDNDPIVVDSWNELKIPGIEVIRLNSILKLEAYISAIHPGKKIVIYFDPPYRFESRKKKTSVYNCEMNNDDHIKFLELLQRLERIKNIDLIVSHYPDPVYNEYLSGWRTIQFNSMTRQGVAFEKLYMNYEHNTGELHQYDYIGENKDERYNLKHRTAKNLIRKIDSLEIRKKQAIIHYVKSYLDTQKHEKHIPYTKKYLSNLKP